MLAVLLTASNWVFASDDTKLAHTYLSCSIITSEHLTTIQLYQRGLPLESALEALPNISREAKKRVKYLYDMIDRLGVLNVYADINTNYARCGKIVHEIRGVPAKDQLEYGYFYCSGENKRRFEILLNANKYKALDSVLEHTPITHQQLAQSYYRLIKDKGLLAAFDFTANNLKACLNNLQQTDF